MNKVKIVFASIVVGILVALTYYFFEAAIRLSIEYVWTDLLDTDSRRVLMVPATIVLGFLFFSTQHLIDRSAEKKEQEGLGESPSPTVLNFIKVLFIGFLSLFAGASLGPEAILIPACIVIGGYVGGMASNKNAKIIKLLEAAGFVALFVGFFNSLIAAALGLYLLRVKTGKKLVPAVIGFSAISSASAFIVLRVIEAPPLISLPPHTWKLSISYILLLAGLAISGAVYVLLLGFIVKNTVQYKKRSSMSWWQNALLASTVLAGLFYMGGPLVQFTGNESISPMFAEASQLGFTGLLLLVAVKTIAIGWSKASGYRGGMIFPTIFVAASLSAIAQIANPDMSAPLGVFMVMLGAFYVNSRTHQLF